MRFEQGECVCTGWQRHEFFFFSTIIHSKNKLFFQSVLIADKKVIVSKAHPVLVYYNEKNVGGLKKCPETYV